MLTCAFLGAIYVFIPPPMLNILVTGVDARPGEGFAARTDSIMLVSLDPVRRQVSILSIPRDLSLDVPNYGLQRVNVINVLGEQAAQGRGSALLIESIEQNFGVQIDRYARLDFNGFVRLVDAVGGVTIDVEHAITDSNYPSPDGGTMTIQFQTGEQTMDGATALIYARTRYSDDDYRRAARQQQVVSALVGKVINPLTWGAVVTTFYSAVDTDVNIGDMALYGAFAALNAGRFEMLVIDRNLIAGTAEGVAIPDYAALDAWLNAHVR